MTIYDVITKLHPSFSPQTTLFDMDGVICADWYEPGLDPPTLVEGTKWWEHTHNGRVLYRPPGPVLSIVTNRPDFYRECTQRWLRDRGILYADLSMQDTRHPAYSRALNLNGFYKGQAYANADNASLFIESDEQQALTIATVSRKPVFCTETFTSLITRPVKEECYALGGMEQANARFVCTEETRHRGSPASTVLCYPKPTRATPA